MMILAQGFSGQEWIDLGKWIGGLVAFVALLRWLSAAKQDLLSAVKKDLRADKEEKDEAASLAEKSRVPQPLEVTGRLTTQGAVQHLTIEAWQDAEKARVADRGEIIKKLDEIGKNLEESKRYQAKARQRIHKKLNAHENALYFMAGEQKADGNERASRVIRERLAHGNTDDESDEA
jgi:hypothetical protein